MAILITDAPNHSVEDHIVGAHFHSSYFDFVSESLVFLRLFPLSEWHITVRAQGSGTMSWSPKIAGLISWCVLHARYRSAYKGAGIFGEAGRMCNSKQRASSLSPPRGQWKIYPGDTQVVGFVWMTYRFYRWKVSSRFWPVSLLVSHLFSLDS